MQWSYPKLCSKKSVEVRSGRGRRLIPWRNGAALIWTPNGMPSIEVRETWWEAVRRT